MVRLCLYILFWVCCELLGDVAHLCSILLPARAAGGSAVLRGRVMQLLLLVRKFGVGLQDVEQN